MAHFFLLLLAYLALQTLAGQPDLSRIDRLLEARYGPRSQRESNFDPRNYPQNVRLNEVDANSDSLRTKNRCQDDDEYVQKNRPPIRDKSQEATEGKKMMPIVHPIPVIVPLLVAQPFPVPLFPVNSSRMDGRRYPEEKVRGYEHEYVVLSGNYEHGHEMSGNGH